MTDFVFKAPSLYDPDAVPDPGEGYLNEDQELGERLARQKRLALWLRDKLVSRGIDASRVVWDESGWGFSVNGKDGFVQVLLDCGSDGELFELVVSEISSASAEYAGTVAAFAALLRDAPETELVEVVD